MAKHNKGFSLIELLIAMTILSIIMVMVGQFMSSSTMASKKVKDNLEVQSEAMEVMTNISDSIEQASYVRVTVASADAVVKEIEDVSGGKTSATRTRTVKDASSVVCTKTHKEKIAFDLVSDDYANYIRPDGSDERKVIIDFEEYLFVPQEVGKTYPLSGDKESNTSNGLYQAEARSFRALRVGDKYYYVAPKYLYLEYRDVNTTGNVVCVIYRFDYANSKIYLLRKSMAETESNRYSTMTTDVEALCSSGGTTGLLTSSMEDFYLSADVEGSALLINSMFEVNGYQYNSVETVKFRNTNAITVRPQKLFKKK